MHDSLISVLKSEIPKATLEKLTRAMSRRSFLKVGAGGAAASRVLAAAAQKAHARGVRTRGVYLITGGMGGIGLELAEFLARTVQAKLILVGRSTFTS